MVIRSIFLSVLGVCVALSTVSHRLRNPVHIRVLLNEITGNGSWRLGSQGGFIVEYLEASNKRFRFNTPELTIALTSRGMYMGARRLPDSGVRVSVTDGHTSVAGNAYQGELRLVRDGDRSYLINVLELEDYIFSVLRTESWPGWPLEVNKAL